MNKGHLVKIAKKLIYMGKKEEAIDLIKLCRESNLDLSKDINYDFKEGFKDSEVLFILIKVVEIDDHYHLYLEIDNMLQEGVEDQHSMIIGKSSKSDIGDKISKELSRMKRDIIEDIVIDAIYENKDAKEQFAEYTIRYIYDGKLTNEILSDDEKQLIEKEITKKELDDTIKESSKKIEELEESFKDKENFQEKEF